MDNIDHIMEVVQLRWRTCALVAMLCIASFLLLRFYKRRRAKVVVILALSAIVTAFAPGIMRDYSVILLDGEEDETAERAFGYLENHLSDKHLNQLLSGRERYNPYLAKDNVRFYLALMAARRGLRIDAADLRAPRFFCHNRYNVFATGQRFPMSYEEFMHKYQQMSIQNHAK
jgi:hypothetical protein